MSVPQFIDDCKRDLGGLGNIFPRHIAQYKQMVCSMDEALELDKTSAHKFKKSVKGLYNSHLGYITNEVGYAEIMEKMGSVALSREAETGIGTAFLKLSVITKEFANHRKTMCENLNNMVLFPLNSLLKGDMNKIGDMRKPVEEAWKEYKSKGIKKDARKKTSEIVLYRIDPPENVDESERERRMFMFNACEYLMKANDVKVKKGVELVQHLIEYYHAQLRYFNRGMQLLESMRSYFDGLAGELQQLKTEKDEEKKELTDIKNQLKTILQLDSQKEGGKGQGQNYKLHGQQGDKLYGGEKSGTLWKRSEGVRKQWQKRYCVIKQGQFTLAHNQQSAPTTTLNLLTCQVKPSQEKEKKLTFGLVAHNRTYLFQAEDELDYDAWISVLSNAREEALNIAFGEGEGALCKEPVSSIDELTQGIISEVRRLPGNNQCVDCNAFEPTWLSTNLGVLVCIECSGIHRELGVHVTRIRSLTLDKLGTAELLLARAVGNSGFNEIMEAELDPSQKPESTSKMEIKKDFIQKKYVQKKFYHPSGHSPDVLLEELKQAINYRDILAILQLYADGVDYSSPFSDVEHNNSALHYCIVKEDLTSLHVVDFITQNCKNPNVQNTLGNTALHLTALYNSPECTKLLVRGGIKQDIVNKAGKTALAIAQELGHKEVVELLQDDGRTGKFDHVKIDWGLEETEDIYATPLDLAELKLELMNEAQEKKSAVTAPSLSTPGAIQRSVTSPKNAVKTPAVPTPTATTTISNTSARHSIAFPSDTKVAPPLPEKSHSRPPPPARKAKPKITTPPSGSSAPPIPADQTASLNSASTNPVLSTFAPKPFTKQQTASDKSSICPPAPPTRSSSFIPRGSPNDPTALLPRPDRPPPTPPSAKRGHSRNISEGNIMYHMEAENKERHRTGSVADALYSRPKDEIIPLDPDAPPLPPPRPKPKVDTLAVSNNDSFKERNPPKRTSSLPKRVDGRVTTKYRRAKALYDCDADHDDELSFVEGEIIIMLREADPDWWYGEVEEEPKRKGVFPISFVHVLND